uniref:Uncharacterized protein n=1 Tax=Solanum lycopersicum TaxID=4081 RepID=A0A3Q7I5M9_SOLLC
SQVSMAMAKKTTCLLGWPIYGEGVLH